MNFIKVEVETRGTRLRLPDGQTLVLKRTGKTKTVLKNGTYMWGVRPEHFIVSKKGANAIDVVMDVVQPTGSRTFGSFVVGDTHVVAEFDAHDVNVANQQLALSVVMERTSFFDASTGKALTTS